LSLVELMIAMVIGLVLMAGMGQILLSGKQSFNTQAGMGAIQENGRFAMFFLQRDLRMAGFPKSVSPSGTLPPVADGVSAATAFVLANTTDGGGGAVSDQIAIRFNSDVTAVPNSNLDCLGNVTVTVNAGIPQVINRYFVADLDGNNVFSLYCQGSSANPNTPQPIVDGVENFQVLYGEDTNADNFADVYRRADQVVTWNNVAAVRVALLINSGGAVGEDDDTQQYAVLDAPPITPVNDPLTPNVNELRFRRRVFTTTVEIRNRTQ
jgi:type IV pilus assembly protein PilW